MSYLRKKRKELQEEHNPSPKAWDSNSNQWIDNPELNEKIPSEEEKSNGSEAANSPEE
jgi:hypothetical protein